MMVLALISLSAGLLLIGAAMSESGDPRTYIEGLLNR